MPIIYSEFYVLTFSDEMLNISHLQANYPKGFDLGRGATFW